jgi:transposase
MLFEVKNLRVFLYQESIDMRCGFERLTFYVREAMKNNINSGHVYLFFGKNRRRLKAIYYDGTGLVLVAKKIERGRFMLRAEISEVNEVTLLELKQIFHGGLIVRPRLERSSMTQVGQDLLPGKGQSVLVNAAYPTSQTSLA